MAKRISILTTILFLLMPACIACADVVFKPENDFFNKHISQVVYLSRSFCANGADGSVPIVQEPGSKRTVAKLQNGDEVFIAYSCLYNGEYWGFSFDCDGWVRMNQLLVLYDYVAFAEDHPGEFYQYKGNYEEVNKAGEAVVWPWPGADAPLWTVSDFDPANFSVSLAYLDEQGREWGFVTYLYGRRNIWVCLSDPQNGSLPVLNPAQDPVPWVPETAHEEIEKSASQPFALIVVLVAALAIGTAALIKVFWKPSKNEPGGENHD
ncbi:MAG: hypothetical protein FWG42_11415 [Clostridiales bacterium]|nr:hypothetical protein [Clostridiales bacterium]